MGEILFGKALSQRYKDDIRNFTERLKVEGKKVPCLSAIIVGEDGGSHYYLNSVEKNCKDLGLETKVYKFHEGVSEDEIKESIQKLNINDEVHGIMLFVPLPSHLDEKNITSYISYRKDIDCLTDINNGRLYKGERCFVPCTPQSVIELIKSTGTELQGKNAVIIGRSNIVGKPVAQLLLNENCTVTICHSKTQNLSEVCRRADILVSCVGRPGFVTVDFIKDGAIVIDVGTTSVNGKITGDVLFEEVITKAAYVTPVPGGVGVMTTTMLIKNVCEAYKNNVY